MQGQTMKNLSINYIGLDKLIPYVNNSRTHDDAQIAQIASSIKEFGFTNPVLVDDEGGIIAGHGRVMAARKLNLKDVPTITLTDLTDIQKRAYIIADNKLALNAGWDNELLMIELNALSDADYDLDLTGFSQEELSNLDDLNKSEDKDEKQPKDVNYEASFSIIVECINELEQETIFNELNSKGYKCRVQSL